jgi:hypothetical protein
VLAINWSNWALVLIGAGTAYAVWIQAPETAGATKAMRDSLPFQEEAAEAASKNAQALINAERPWLFISPVGFKLEPSPYNRLDWRISNRGRTVANVIEVKLRCWKCKGMEKILTASPKYTTTINFYGTPIPPDGILEAWSDIKRDGDNTNPMSARDLEDIRLQRDDLVAQSSITYRDQFGQLHESRFCYYYAVPFNEFRINLRAPAEYHECT